MELNNSLDIALNLKQQEKGVGELSDGKIAISYPTMDRDTANVAQLDLTLGTAITIVRWAVEQARQNGVNTEGYVRMLRSRMQEMEQIVASAPIAGASSPQPLPGVIR